MTCKKGCMYTHRTPVPHTHAPPQKHTQKLHLLFALSSTQNAHSPTTHRPRIYSMNLLV